MWNVMIFIASNLLNLTYLSLCICNILNTDLDNEWNFVFTKWTLYNVSFFFQFAEIAFRHKHKLKKSVN